MKSNTRRRNQNIQASIRKLAEVTSLQGLIVVVIDIFYFKEAVTVLKMVDLVWIEKVAILASQNLAFQMQFAV